MFFLDWTVGESVLDVGILAYLSNIIWNQPLLANFFAYFDPKQRLGSRNILFLVCCPAHRKGDVKQELAMDGLTSCDATSTRAMIPGHDKAFVFVSGGVTPAFPERMRDIYLRLVSIFSKGLKEN